MRGYEHIYGISLMEEFNRRYIPDEKEFINYLKKEIEKASYHFGHSCLNIATIAGILRMTVKKYVLK